MSLSHTFEIKHFMLRGSILLCIKTEISDNIDTAPSEVEVEPTQSINEVIILISDIMRMINDKNKSSHFNKSYALRFHTIQERNSSFLQL